MDGPREGRLILLFLVATPAASAFVPHRAEANAVKNPKQKAARGEITEAEFQARKQRLLREV